METQPRTPSRLQGVEKSAPYGFSKIKDGTNYRLTDAQKQRIQNMLTPITYDPNGTQSYINEIRETARQAFPSDLVQYLVSQKSRTSHAAPILKLKTYPRQTKTQPQHSYQRT